MSAEQHLVSPRSWRTFGSSAHTLLRVKLSEVTSDPWRVLEDGFADSTSWPEGLREVIAPSVGLEWTRIWNPLRTVLKLLSTMDLRPDQIALLMSGKTAGGLRALELLDDPYLAAVCTYSARPDRCMGPSIARLFPLHTPGELPGSRRVSDA